MVNDSRVTAFGGQGGCGTFGCGGNGGSGRIRIDADVFTGETMPSPESVPYRKTFNVLVIRNWVNRARHFLFRILLLWLGNRFQ